MRETRSSFWYERTDSEKLEVGVGDLRIVNGHTPTTLDRSDDSIQPSPNSCIHIHRPIKLQAKHVTARAWRLLPPSGSIVQTVVADHRRLASRGGFILHLGERATPQQAATSMAVMQRATIPRRPRRPLLLLLTTLVLALLVPPAAAGRGFGVSARGNVHTAIPKRLLRDEAGAAGSAEDEEEEPPPPSFLEEVGW